jgi:MoaA/NifB/PqqE/SkfB family radical SAM enzyme
MRDSMCVVPFSSLVIQPDGRANFCCDAPLSLTVDGRPGQLGRDAFDDLWNSVELVEVRGAMARGDRPVACQACWDREDKGITSRRHVYNSVYRQAEGEMDLVAVAEAARETGGRVERAPDWFVVELGSVCNLRCRSCGPLSSSRIAADPLHAAWNDTRDLRRAPSGAHDGTWFRQVDDLADMIAAGAQGTAMLSLMGGEPLLIKQTWELLEASSSAASRTTSSPG